MRSIFPRSRIRSAAVSALLLTAGLLGFNPDHSHGQAAINSKRPVETPRRSNDPLVTQQWKFVWKADESRSVDRILISLQDQKVYAYQNGKVVLETPCSTGRPGHTTPAGTWKIFFKNANHYSGSYGAVVDSRGRMINADATPGSYVPAGGAYLRAPMPYFMKFVGGIGLHTGLLPGYPASHGCIRLPNEAARRLFDLTPIGTPVTVSRGSGPT